MRKIAFILLIGCGMMSGGCRNMDPFVYGVDAGWEVIGPEYKRYVDRDPTIDNDSKLLRKRTAIRMDKLIAEAKKLIEKETSSATTTPVP
jgi:hypothetical protein